MLKILVCILLMLQLPLIVMADESCENTPVTRILLDTPLALDVTLDGSLLAVSAKDGIHIFDTRTFEEMKILPFESLVTASAIAWSSDNESLAVYISGRGIEIWNIAKNQAVSTLPEQHYDDQIHTLEWSPDGTKLVEAGEANTRVWDIETGTIIFNLEIPSTVAGMTIPAKLASWSLDNRWLAVVIMGEAYSDRVTIWDISSWTLLDVIDADNTFIQAIEWGGNSQLAIAALSSSATEAPVKIWSIAERCCQIIENTESSTSIAWSSSGRQLAIGRYGFQIFDLEKQTFSPDVYSDRMPTDLYWLAPNLMISSIRGEAIEQWNLTTGCLTGIIESPE